MKLSYGVFAANTNILDRLRHWVAKIYINQSCLYCKNITNYLIFFFNLLECIFFHHGRL